MKMLAFCVTAVVAAIAVPVFLAAGSAPAEDEIAKTSPQPTVKKGTQVRKPVRRTVRELDETPIGKTIRLTITLNNDDGAHPFPVTCAARSYFLERDITEVDGGHQLKIGGYIKAVDQPEKIFARFEIEQYHSNDNEGVDATFRLQGSAILKMGKKVDIGHLGEDKVTLMAEAVE